MKGRYAKFFAEIDDDIAVDEIEDYTVKWLEEDNNIPWDDMDEADQNSFVEETFLEVAYQYVVHCWNYFGHGDYQWEVENNHKLHEKTAQWVYDILPRLSYIRVLNKLEERMIG